MHILFELCKFISNHDIFTSSAQKCSLSNMYIKKILFKHSQLKLQYKKCMYTIRFYYVRPPPPRPPL